MKYIFKTPIQFCSHTDFHRCLRVSTSSSFGLPLDASNRERFGIRLSRACLYTTNPLHHLKGLPNYTYTTLMDQPECGPVQHSSPTRRLGTLPLYGEQLITSTSYNMADLKPTTSAEIEKANGFECVQPLCFTRHVYLILSPAMSLCRLISRFIGPGQSALICLLPES